MLFNSLPFLFLFLPLTLLGFLLLVRLIHNGPRAASGWLVLASLFFYGWWNPPYVALLLASMVFNFLTGNALARACAAGRPRQRLLTAAIAADLLLLGYYKYANFFVDNANALLHSEISLGHIVLPLGISFFTFTQIAWLVDAAQGHTYKGQEGRFLHYALFVTWFPHLIAGPILHHAEMMPQFAQREAGGSLPADRSLYSAGLTLLVLGLAKKVLVADEIGAYVAPFFEAARAGSVLTLLEAWCGALAYTFQLYFDFSAYSDMAIGLSLLFGIRLPLNFNSPYKATDIIDFWRRWHMTLSRFLRDYLYVPLGGNRKGRARRYANLLLTMLLGGLWHGAGWTFVAWGALHGVYLCINHGWRALGVAPRGNAWRWFCRLLTFAAVVAGWVVFRADSLGTAGAMLQGMAGINGFALPDQWLPKWGALGATLAAHGVAFSDAHGLVTGGLINWLVALLVVVWCAPNTQQIMSRAQPALDTVTAPARWWRWRPRPWLALPLAVLALAVVVNLHKKSEFLYFQF